ncbi:toxin-antitoxin system HicB family antitoxin [Halomonas sp. AOP27-A1-41]|uniref:toxin-antitoxin system HicB family antitoxin n=1 Tax=Halomonas sp. AOP27-A1-41 TaxID=3457707 RepID=UPI0040339D14
MRADSYNIVTRYIDEDNGYEAKVVELPDVAEYGDTQSEAYALALDTIDTTAEIMAEKGRQMPSPIVHKDDYSGRITLRIPKTLHASLSDIADKEGASLNQMITTILASFRGFDCAMEDTMDGWVKIKETETRIRPKVASQKTLKVLTTRNVGNSHDWHNSPRLRTA